MMTDTAVSKLDKVKLEGTRTQVIFLARATLQKAKPQTNIYKYC